MFDYKLIEALAMVAREGGFDKAARTMYITQSAVSQRVKLLEEHTGQVLLARTTPPQATSAGQKLEQTHQLLKDGEVMGCISTIAQPMQGCRIEYIGRMNYRMMAAPEFATRWFPDGLVIEDVRRAPAIIFDRQDELHHKLLYQALEEVPAAIPTNYVPSVEKFAEFIALGLAYGMLPDQQSTPLIGTGQMVDLSPDCHVPVKLYWHCWNLKSDLLKKLTQQLISQAKTLLEE
jgi:LysR family transcriptional regulator (chromosome initiation inhibitor)